MAGPKHQRYITKGDNLVSSEKSTLYYDAGDQALYKIVDTRLLGYEWVLIWSYENTSDNDYTQKNTITTTLRTKTGSEAAENFKVSAGFSGMGITATAEAGVEHKTFTEEETTSTTQREQTYTVKPHSSVFIYQKVYNFQVDVWFKLDAWAKYWTVGNWQRDGVAQVSSGIAIYANEFAQTGEALGGKADLVPETVQSADEKTNIRRFEDCTKRAQSYLHERGV
ncbi:hypothetical protein ANOM_004526 [Aspergillus nomiae NRRL 13137]|uniref:Uncharacterized protein n=1 Tax=Aspergillus nomiae NRRL (strain ATCC 15546 / NRRL 13137 / CBS 260.88 / M93) TaxID=1509407 RepID=A0A0L1J3F5_ASPN3|nr:uncharacterized protein ANOM_004526 [Aspergillus nomiae NRRL 13137]KNG86277.1 hypothetical protein ANOM_004526 [Aspergillus nomiae NRRL 13137]